MHEISSLQFAEAPEAAESLLYICKLEIVSDTSVRHGSAPGSHPPITYTFVPSVTAWEAMRACMRRHVSRQSLPSVGQHEMQQCGVRSGTTRQPFRKSVM